MLTAAPALAQGTQAASFAGAASIAIAAGAGAFALLSMVVIRTMLTDGKAARRKAAEQIAGLRALIDEYEALLSGSREVTVLWTDEEAPKLLGQAAAILPIGRQPESVLNFQSWLTDADAVQLARLLEDLRVYGHAFAVSLNALDGRLVRANGWVLGGGAAMRLRPAFQQPVAEPNLVATAMAGENASVRAILATLTKPAFVRDSQDRLIYANHAYHELARALGKTGSDNAPPELLEPARLKQHLRACDAADEPTALSLSWGAHGAFELVELPIAGGRAGLLRPVEDHHIDTADDALAHISGIIDTLATPIAIFNARRELIQFNHAYEKLWNLSGGFLTLGLDERAILDKLRTEGMLPAQVNYHIWRDAHLKAYGRTEPFEDDPWHLPDGRTIKVISAPAGTTGGVIYVFDDITERLKLESSNKALSNVQRETINSLSEAVAVFGTNGRLTLSNPRLSALWKLPTNELGQNPHIDQIAEASGRAIPDDGASIWRDLKRGIIDLNPTRSDQTGRINRSDGRLLDYAITRLPDGQTMMTFLDVTESASYSKVLKERNDALVAADVLKDAFVENVSYELRSPLTNIIGFAEMLATDAGPLNERQSAYVDYIRASSVTLGVLIDNILDLASVDAGIAELRPKLLDVERLVNKARAGLSASFPEISGERPINLVVEIDPDLPPFIADGTRIVQVLYNLLSNAARFSPPGGEIKLSISHRGERMLFVIEDEGPGLTDEMKSAILTRLDNPNGGRQRGAGLGLAIVKTFVNLHGGTISAERREPRGSRIIVNLPRDSAMAAVAE
ncbi:MAG: PAS-domain containing protein [Candidatus Devosia euplotis]|nr:PAS-domain containing protein [Candidatus Devosia euplotis]